MTGLPINSQRHPTSSQPYHTGRPLQQHNALSTVQDIYEIRIKECLDRRWSEWFDGWSIAYEENGTTLLRGPVPDQAALYGTIAKMSHLNLTIKSVLSIGLDSADVLQNPECRESITSG